MSRYLLDTNILSEPLKPSPNPLVVERFEQNTNEITIASVSWHELRYGCSRLPTSKRKSQIEQYLVELQATFPILPYEQSAADWHGLERLRLESLGRSPAFADGQIAAIASTNNLILVTRNVSDFEHFQSLQIEDWFA